MATQLHAFRRPARIMPRHRRKEIEAEIAGCLQRVEMLIARLDRQDAPFEDMEDDDPAGGAADDVGEHPTDDGTPLMALAPLYLTDQTGGPINAQAGYKAWHRSRDSR